MIRFHVIGTRSHSLRRLIGVSDTTGLFTLTYDTLNRLTSFNAPNHPHGLPLTYGYDPNSNLTSVQGWFGFFTATYDHDDQMASFTDPGYASPSIAGGVNNYTHDPRGQVSRINFVNGSRVTTTFDALGRVSQLRHEASTSTEIAHVYLTYDPAGRPTLKQTQAGNTTYAYDAADQLVSEWGPASGLLTYGYDASHRRVLVQSPTAPWTTASYDAADELLWTQTGSAFTTLGYDLNGSTTSVVGPTGSRTTYLWDAVNRLSSVTLPTGAISTQTYRYDDLRIGQLSSAGRDTFVYDRPGIGPLRGASGSQNSDGGSCGCKQSNGCSCSCCTEGNQAGGSLAPAASSTDHAHLPNVLFWQRGGSGPQELFSYGDNLLRAVGTNSTGATLNRQFHLDALGNVVATTTSSQSVETTYQTDAWGNVLSGSANSNPAIYLGGLGYWQEAALGLDHVRSRWLNPGTGSWLSVDPVSSEPRYLYAHNQPTRKVDPSGRQSQEGVTPPGQQAQPYVPFDVLSSNLHPSLSVPDIDAYVRARTPWFDIPVPSGTFQSVDPATAARLKRYVEAMQSVLPWNLRLMAYHYAGVAPSGLDLVATDGTIQGSVQWYLGELSRARARTVARCGPEIGPALRDAIVAVIHQWENWHDPQKKWEFSRALVDLPGSLSSWDIIQLGPDRENNFFSGGLGKVSGGGGYRKFGCATLDSRCYDTVMVDGQCHLSWAVNYIIYGVMNRLAYDYAKSGAFDADSNRTIQKARSSGPPIRHIPSERHSEEDFTVDAMLTRIHLWKHVRSPFDPADALNASEWAIAGYRWWCDGKRQQLYPTPVADIYRAHCQMCKIPPEVAHAMTFQVHWNTLEIFGPQWATPWAPQGRFR